MKFIQYGKVSIGGDCYLQFHFRVYNPGHESFVGPGGSCSETFAMKHKKFYYQG